MSPARLVALLWSLASLSACLVAPFGADLDPAQIPSQPPQASDAIGPIDARAEGVTHGIGWRFYVYESAAGWCTGLDLGDGSSSISCGGLDHTEEVVFRSVSSMSRVFEGVVSAEAADVLLETDEGGRLPGTLIPLQRPRLDGSAFIVAYPEGARPQKLVATDENGEDIDEFDVTDLEPNVDQPPETTSSD